MHITLTGNLGSGKSTISKIINEKYGYEIFSTGKINRQLAEERGISVLEMNQLMQKDHSYDHLIDETTTKISKEKKEDIFFDSRLAWHFAVNCFKVFLAVNIDEAARRVYADSTRGDVEKYASVEDAKDQLLKRAETEDVRYKDIYGIDYFKTANYDLILDSTFSAPETLAEMLISAKAAFEKHAAEKPDEAPIHRILLSPAGLLGYVKEGKRPDITKPGCIYESTAKVEMKVGRFELVSGAEEVKKAVDEGYEFIAVRG